MDNLGFGLQTTVLGMGIVFLVLVLLWLILNAVTRLDARPAPSDDDGARAVVDAGDPVATAALTDGPRVVLAGDVAGLDPRLLAAITVAIVRHEEARRLQAAPVMRSYWPGSLLFASRWVAAGRTRQGQSWRRRR